MPQWLADRLVLCPSRDKIDFGAKIRREVPFEGATVEVFTERFHTDRAPQLYVLKLGGTGGRAERAGPHPLDAWSDLAGETWAVNPPGYGGSGGRATLVSLAAAIRAVCEALIDEARGAPIIVTGNSLGTATALHVASRYRQIVGCILRNPPPLRPLINGQYGLVSLGLAHLGVARYVPAELDSVAQAARTKVPAVFVLSQKDRVVPPKYQRLITDAYAGPQQQLLLAEADHASPLDEREQQQYFEQLRWLRAASLGF
ncbi:hypothetical protein Psta_0152 [Pirellula staleyi DSM 6068]|uniref:Uncharacterized protein n=1 Tax=Pirellula staleyi (strain ATCC 27377 / DSM 6068 / ICPB 4128) TaxID=530564 RepID=D2R0I0_PIRSD|nr:alpha/beta fold hydrolase [Pirellula staleyi]ADB14848.1 hypothetical protein Psta_0152 [Pirellula staleyi DSM 6068]